MASASRSPEAQGVSEARGMAKPSPCVRDSRAALRLLTAPGGQHPQGHGPTPRSGGTPTSPTPSKITPNLRPLLVISNRRTATTGSGGLSCILYQLFAVTTCLLLLTFATQSRA